jgi:hypothetical protein
VNREIVAKGYGLAYTKYPFAYMEEFRAAEREAREKCLGPWGPIHRFPRATRRCS